MQHVLTLPRGAEVISELNKYAIQYSLGSAWVNGLGGASDVILGFYDIKTKQYIWKQYNEALEIVNITGNLSWVDGKPHWHMHAVLSDKTMKSYGGHVKVIRVGLACELLISPLEQKFTRIPDEKTGLKLLSPVYS